MNKLYKFKRKIGLLKDLTCSIIPQKENDYHTALIKTLQSIEKKLHKVTS